MSKSGRFIVKFVLGLSLLVVLFVATVFSDRIFKSESSLWNKLGINPYELKSNIQEFPRRRCNVRTKVICENLSRATLSLLRLDRI